MKSFRPITAARDFLVDAMSTDTFLGRGGYVMRVPYYICPFDPKEAVLAEELRLALVRDLAMRGVSVNDVNLYDVVLEILDETGAWGPIEASESSYDKEDLKDMLQNVLDVESVLAPKIMSKRLEGDERNFDVVFISGVGETFPYIRTHMLFELLHVDEPVVLFFPGKYCENDDYSTSLDILDIPSGAGGGYYRASNIFNL